SSCIYPKFARQPISENALLEGPLEKTNEAYALAKISGIKLCEALRNQYKFDAISCMPTNLYGPFDNYNYENSHVLPAFIRKFVEAKNVNKSEVICWGTGSPYREFMHVDDLADASIFLLENWVPLENINWINVGTGKDITIKELATKISSLVGYEGKIVWDDSKPNGTPRKRLCVDKINSLGWESKINLDDGIKNTINCFLEEKAKGIIRR
ncbi:NAD-dependent epimerase/dehydratase family protein, partial [Prochlorococcus sp. AH-736-P13]